MWRWWKGWREEGWLEVRGAVGGRGTNGGGC